MRGLGDMPCRGDSQCLAFDTPETGRNQRPRGGFSKLLQDSGTYWLQFASLSLVSGQAQLRKQSAMAPDSSAPGNIPDQRFD